MKTYLKRAGSILIICESAVLMLYALNHFFADKLLETTGFDTWSEDYEEIVRWVVINNLLATPVLFLYSISSLINNRHQRINYGTLFALLSSSFYLTLLFRDMYLKSV